MNVTILTPSVSRELGGIYEIERCLAKALSRSTPVDIEVAGLEDEHTKEDLPEWLPLEPTVYSVRGPSAFGYAPGLVRGLKKARSDLVHLHSLWMYTSIAARQWAAETGRPHVVTVHGMLDDWALNNSRWKKRIAGWLYEDANLQQAACLQVNTEKERKAVREYGIDTPVCIVPNGVSIPDSGPPSTPPWTDTIAPEQKVLLFLGRIHPKKGLRELLEGWKQVQDQTSDSESWSLAVVGWDDGGHLPGLKSYAEENGIDSSVHFLGPMFGEQKQAAFQHADAFILPSYSEGLPMAVLEAWSYGLPVLMTEACNLEEGFEEEAAFKISPDPTDIVEGLSDVIRCSDSTLTEIGRRGRDLVERKFTWGSVAEQMHQVYRWVLGEREAPDTVRMN